MNPWTLGFILPVILYVGFNTEATVVRSTGREPVAAPACDNATLDNISLKMCTVTTISSRGQACGLVYRDGRSSTGKCDSRFTLRAENHTVFLYLANLTSDDSGSYTCNCSHAHGINQLHLDLKVQGEGQSSSALTMLSRTTVIVNAAALVLVSGFVLGLALRKKHCRQRAEAGRCGSPACGAFCTLALTSRDKVEPGDLYVNLRQLSADVHQQRSRKTNPARNTKGSQTVGRDPDQIYVNI